MSRYFRIGHGKTILNRIDEDGPWTNWDLYHLAYETEKSLLVPTMDYKHRNIYPISRFRIN